VGRAVWRGIWQLIAAVLLTAAAQAAASRPPRDPGRRPPGKQPGAPGAHLGSAAEADEVVVHRPEICGGCGASLLLAPVTGVAARQVADLPEVRLRVIEHRAERRRCGCGQFTAAVCDRHADSPDHGGPPSIAARLAAA
jgi:transposase